MPTYCYSLYGLTLDSVVDCPHLPVGQGKPDVVIRYRHTPTVLDPPTDAGVCYQTGPDQLLLQIEDTARYWVRSGSSIAITPAPVAEAAAVRLFLLGSALGGLLHQRGDLVLHGSSILTPPGAVIFLGASGMGKSTLAAGFWQRGYPVLTDDVAVIRATALGLRLFPGAPQIKLWADSCHHLQQDLGQLQPIRHKLHKYLLPLAQSLDPVDPTSGLDAYPIARIYVLNTTHRDEHQLLPLDLGEQLTVLVRQTYREQYLKGMGLRSQHFRLCTQLMQTTPLYRLIRPRDRFCLGEVLDRLDQHFKEHP